MKGSVRDEARAPEEEELPVEDTLLGADCDSGEEPDCGAAVVLVVVVVEDEACEDERWPEPECPFPLSGSTY